MEYLILQYPDLVQGYVLYTDASGIGWSGVLTQEHTDEKGKSKNHPICYVSDQFWGSQLNWAALTKEAYAIYMSIRRLSFYVTNAEVTIRNDHLPLRKFLNKQTMNSKVNNWAVELEQFKLHLEWIPGSHNLLADSLSHLIDVIPDTQQPDEPEDHEFESYCFEELEPAKITEVISTETIEMEPITSKVVEHSLESRKPTVKDDTVPSSKNKFWEKQQPQVGSSKSGESSQNSWISTEVGIFELKYEEKLLGKGHLLNLSESSEHSQNSRKDTCIKITEHEDVREITLPLKPKQLQELQKNDMYCRDIAKKLPKDVELQKIFIKEKGVLY